VGINAHDDIRHVDRLIRMHIEVLKFENERTAVFIQGHLGVLNEVRQTLKIILNLAFLVAQLEGEYRSLMVEDLLDLAQDRLSLCLQNLESVGSVVGDLDELGVSQHRQSIVFFRSLVLHLVFFELFHDVLESLEVWVHASFEPFHFLWDRDVEY